MTEALNGLVRKVYRSTVDGVNWHAEVKLAVVCGFILLIKRVNLLMASLGGWGKFPA